MITRTCDICGYTTADRTFTTVVDLPFPIGEKYGDSRQFRRYQLHAHLGDLDICQECVLKAIREWANVCKGEKE